MTNNIYYIIPAREGSKGFPGKNRALFPFTIAQLPDDVKSKTIVTTDDPEIIRMAVENKMTVINRKKEHATDDASIKLVLADVVDMFLLNDNDILVMLYLTYPGRKWIHVEQALARFSSLGAKSLLCYYPAETHPFLCVYGNGKQIVKHDLYRRQDYPEVYAISHYIFIARVGELYQLNKNLYNDKTKYMRIEKPIDVDCKEDLERFTNG